MPRKNVNCEECQKQIRSEEVAYFSDPKKSLDFCSEDCYSEWKRWENIHLDFANKYCQQQWKNMYFTYEQIKELIEVGFKPNDYSKVSEWARQGFTTEEIVEWTKVGFQPGDYYDARQWKSLNFTSQQAKSWKDSGFTNGEAKNWIGSSLSSEEVSFAIYLRDNKLSNYVNNNSSNRSQYWLDTNYPLDTRKEVLFLDISNKNLGGTLKIEGFANLQIFICSNNKLSSLEFDSQSLTNLTRLDCSYNAINQIGLVGDKQKDYDYEDYDYGSHNNNIYSNLSSAVNLEKFLASDNCFQCFPQFRHSHGYRDEQNKKLVHFDMRNNPLNTINMEIFSCFFNLEVLLIGREELKTNDYAYSNYSYGPFSFKTLRNLTNLKRLHIDKLGTIADLEYLPESLENFSFQGCSQIETKLKDYNNSLPNWRVAQSYYNLYQESKQELEKNQKEIISSQEKLETKEKDELNLIQQLKSKQEELKQLQSKNVSYQQFVKNLLESKKNSLVELVQQLKNKLGEGQEWLETFLQIQEELVKSPDNSFVKDQETKTQNILNKKLTEEEIKLLLAKQKELMKLEEQLIDLQINEQTTQIEIPPK